MTNAGNCGRSDVSYPTGRRVHGTCTCDRKTANCPAPCFCACRFLGGTACAGTNGPVSVACSIDAQCPLPGFCLDVGFCPPPCNPA